MYVIPSKDSKKFSQPNMGDTQGNLWSAYNIDVTKNPGRIRTTRCQNVYNQDDDSSLGSSMAFAFYDPTNNDDPIFVAYNGSVFFGGSEPTDTFTQDSRGNTPTSTSRRGDMKVFNDKLYATTNSRLKRLDHGDASWTNIHTLTTLTHQLCVYDTRLYIVNEGDKVISMDTSETVVTSGSFTIDLSPFGGHIAWIVPGSNCIWIGFTKNDGTNGLIFEWDGKTENQASRNYIIEAQGSDGCAIWNDIPYVLDIEGRLLAFNGSNFQEVARLPILQYDVLNSSYASNGAAGLIHFNGIRFMNDAIFMLVDNQTTGTLGAQENFLAGIYEYTKENGLIHKFSPSLTELGGSVIDYGATEVASVGAIFDATARKSNVNNYTASVMFGCAIKTTSTGQWDAIFTDAIGSEFRQSGYIVTSWLESDQVTDVWKAIVVKYRKFLGETDNIVVKYRVTKDVPLVDQNVEWLDDTSMSIDSTIYNQLAVGDEVEVIAGVGAGKCAHITSLSNAGSVYTVTVDSSVPGAAAGEESHVRFQKWIKLSEIDQTNVQYVNLPLPLTNKDTQIQIKVVAEWVDHQNEIREIIVVNDTNQNAK